MVKHQINPYHHLLFWILFSLSFAVLEWGYNNTFWEAIILDLFLLPARAIAVYINWIYLIPLLLYKGKVRSYALSVLGILLVVTLFNRLLALFLFYPIFFPEWMYTEEVQTYLENGVTKERTVKVYQVFFWYPYRLLQNLIVISIPIIFTTGWKLLLDWYQERKRSLELQQEKMEAELKYLKSQVNPHFLFNTLNNIYGLARERSSKVPDLILKLSDILNYTLYETTAKRIALHKELALIENMVNLEKDRYGKRVQIELRLPDEKSDLQIAPLLLVPLVENAFKHGVRNELIKAEVWITADISGHTFSFFIENSIAAKVNEPDANSGLGLANLRKRLDLLYPSRHQLSLSEKEDHFLAQLQVNLEP